MISWRYHLVSIVAVFLALGLGVLAGTTVLDQGLVNNLRDSTAKLRTDLGDLRATVDDLQSRLGTMNAYADQALPYMVQTRLTGRQVIIVTQEGVDGAALSEVRHALDLSGAQVLTTLSVRPEMAATTPGSKKDLAAVVGLPASASSEELSTAAAELLAERLSQEPHGNQSVNPSDPLGQLLSQGFLTASAPGLSDSTLGDLGGRGQIVVTVGGGAADTAPPSGMFMVPLVQALVGLGVTTGAAEGAAAESTFVLDVRSAIDAGQSPLVTVDDVDLAVGGAALILGLERADVAGTGGNYGVKDGASRLLPPLG